MDDRGPLDLERRLEESEKYMYTVKEDNYSCKRSRKWRLNEILTFNGVREVKKTKKKSRQWDGVSRPSNDTYTKNWHDIFGKKEIDESTL